MLGHACWRTMRIVLNWLVRIPSKILENYKQLSLVRRLRKRRALWKIWKGEGKKIIKEERNF